MDSIIVQVRWFRQGKSFLSGMATGIVVFPLCLASGPGFHPGLKDVIPGVNVHHRIPLERPRMPQDRLRSGRLPFPLVSPISAPQGQGWLVPF
jgi:hypothetical protein